MKSPAFPPSEERRLATLHALGLLDTLPEARFEDISGRPLLKLLPEKDRLRFEVEAAALQRADDGMASLEYAGAVRRRDGVEVAVTLVFFRTMAAGRGVTAVLLRPA